MSAARRGAGKAHVERLSDQAAAYRHVEEGRKAAEEGQVERARRHFLAALRLLRRTEDAHRARSLAASGLFHLAAAEGDRREAERWARVSLRAFGRVEPVMFEAAHQVAEQHVAEGDYAVAIPLLRRARHGRIDPDDRIRTVTLRVRAAALAGRRRTLRRAWSEARALIREHTPRKKVARRLLDLADAGAGLVERAWLRAVLEHARETAEACGDEALAREAAARLAAAGPAKGAE